MAILRINKTKNYTVMSNHHLKRKDLSLKAKGLLSVMLALPEDWDYSINGLVAISKENETAIRSTLAELKENNYLVVTKLMPNKTESGRIEYIYDIYEEPQLKQEGEKQGLENLPLEILGLENQGQLNKEQLNTKELNTKERDTHFVEPTFEEVEAYAKSRGREDLARKFFDFFQEGNWVDSKGQRVRNWKQKFLTWCNKEESVVFVGSEKTDVIHDRKYSAEELEGLVCDIDTIEI